MARSRLSLIDFTLTPEEVRVLGCLIEKEMTPPDYYPLSVNALQNACDQTSNWHSVVAYDEQTLLATLPNGAGSLHPIPIKIYMTPKE
jgi:uncharacterized protein YceH (UPF0502 family)